VDHRTKYLPVNRTVDSRGEVMRSEKNRLVIFQEERVGGRANNNR